MRPRERRWGCLNKVEMLKTPKVAVYSPRGRSSKGNYEEEPQVVDISLVDVE